MQFIVVVAHLGTFRGDTVQVHIWWSSG